MKNNFIFFGTPIVASRTLEILKASGYLPSLIVTSHDKPAGRGLHMTPTPVSIWAEENNITCLKPEKITQEFIEKLMLPPVGPMASHKSDLGIDLFIVVAYGKILPETLINTSRLGTINIHYSLLPRWRGASPLEAALLNGDDKTGVSIQQMAYKLDSGPVIAENEIGIDDNTTKEELRDKLIKMGGELLCDILPSIFNKSISPQIQDETKATYCKKINKEDGEIDLAGNQRENFNKYRAFSGWPGVYFFTTKHNKKIRVKIKEAIFENNQFIVKRVTPEGKKEINYEDFLNQN